MNPHTAFLITVKQASTFLALAGAHTSGTEAEAVRCLQQAGTTVNAPSTFRQSTDEPIRSSTRFLVTLEQASYMLALSGSLATDIETVMLLGRVGAVEHSAPQQYESSTAPRAASRCTATSPPPSIPSVRGEVDHLSHQLTTGCVISSTHPNPTPSARARRQGGFHLTSPTSTVSPRSRDPAPCSPVTSPASPRSVTSPRVTNPSGRDRALTLPSSVTSHALLPSAVGHQVANPRTQVRAPIAQATAAPSPITFPASPPSAPHARVANPVTQAPPYKVTCPFSSPSAGHPQAADPRSRAPNPPGPAAQGAAQATPQHRLSTITSSQGPAGGSLTSVPSSPAASTRPRSQASSSGGHGTAEKYCAIIVGRKVGVVYRWISGAKYVLGYSSNVYKLYPTKKEALDRF